MTITVTAEQIPEIVEQARQAAYAAATQYFQTHLGGKDNFPCGFAWVKIKGVRGNTKIGRAFKQCDITPSLTGGLKFWNPSDLHYQNVNTLEHGAQAAAGVFKQYGFDAYAESRLD